MNLELIKTLSVEEKFSLLWEVTKNWKKYPIKKVKILRRELLKDSELYELAKQEGLTK